MLDPAKPPTGANLKTVTLDQLVRPYPQVVAGTPESWSYADGTFKARWTAGKGESEIVLPARVYPKGYAAQVQGGSITSAKGDRLLRVTACAPEVAVTVTRSGKTRRDLQGAAARGEGEAQAREGRQARAADDHGPARRQGRRRARRQAARTRTPRAWRGCGSGSRGRDASASPFGRAAGPVARSCVYAGERHRPGRRDDERQGDGVRRDGRHRGPRGGRVPAVRAGRAGSRRRRRRGDAGAGEGRPGPRRVQHGDARPRRARRARQAAGSPTHLGRHARRGAGRPPQGAAPRPPRPHGDAAAPDVAAGEARVVSRVRAAGPRRRAALGGPQGARAASADGTLAGGLVGRVGDRAARSLETLDWDAQALELAGVERREQLADLACATSRRRSARRARRGGRGRRAAGEPRHRRGAPRRRGAVDRHERRAAPHRRAPRGGSRAPRVLLRPDPRPLVGRRRDQQRRRGAAVGARGARARVGASRELARSGEHRARRAATAC